MSNIPFNTVASVLGTTTVARELATVQDKKLQDQIRGQRHLARAAQTSNEEVDDPGDHEIQHLHDEDKHNPQQEKDPNHRTAEEQVDIAGIEVQATAPPPTPSPLSHLDISA